MRLFLITATLTLLTFKVLSQNDKTLDFSKVDKFALQVPDSEATTVEKLAAYLTTTPMTSSTEKKVRAIYVWVSHNIKYDDNFDLTSPFTTADVVATQDADRVLATRTGVCMGYAHLFVALMQAAGLKAEMVEGIIKQTDGNIPKMGHAWVAVRLRKKADKDAKTEPRWYLCDPTWAVPKSKADYGTVNESYFLAEPEDFIANHLPLDPMWQLLERPATVDVFSKENDDKIKKYVSKSTKNPFVYQDTINRFLKMDSLKRLEKATWRMLHYNPVNDYIWFEVGKVYSNHFKKFEYKINDLIQQSLAASTVLADDEKFDNMLGILRLYATTFKDCFDKIEDKTFAKMNPYGNDSYIVALTSTYRGGYQTAILNRLIENNGEKTPRILEMVKNSGDKADSTFSAARHNMKSLDTNQQRSIELRLRFFELVAYQKRCVFLFQYLEHIRMNGTNASKKSDIYNLLREGRMFIRKYQESTDSLSIIAFGEKKSMEADVVFTDTYAFFFDVEECALNGTFSFYEIEKKREKGSSNELIAYIQELKDVQKCSDFVKEKGSSKSKNIDDLIKINAVFFKQIDGVNVSKLGELHYLIAISIWNENLSNPELSVKNSINAYFNLSDGYVDNALGIYADLLLKDKAHETQIKQQIAYLKGIKNEVAKLRKDMTK